MITTESTSLDECKAFNDGLWGKATLEVFWKLPVALTILSLLKDDARGIVRSATEHLPQHQIDKAHSKSVYGSFEQISIQHMGRI